MTRDQRRGAALIWGTACLSGLLAFASLSVDLGRVALARAVLQDTADATALAAAQSYRDTASTTTARQVARDTAELYTIDGRRTDFSTDAQLEFGRWDAGTRVFTPAATGIDSVRVTVSRTRDTGHPIPVYLAAAIGHDSQNVSSSAVAMITAAGTSRTASVASTADPFVAGMANGRRIYDPWGGETVGSTRAAALTGFTLTPGQTLQFTATGSTSYSASAPYTANADGFTSSITSLWYPAEFPGMAATTAPNQALMAVFLNDADPSTQGAAPAALNFSSSDQINYRSLSPQLRQPFFVGTGTNPDGTKRRVTIPPGATRLFFGTMDSTTWRDNRGSYSVAVARAPTTVIAE
jgi:hypothetical protein